MTGQKPNVFKRIDIFKRSVTPSSTLGGAFTVFLLFAVIAYCVYLVLQYQTALVTSTKTLSSSCTAGSFTCTISGGCKIAALGHDTEKANVGLGLAQSLMYGEKKTLSFCPGHNEALSLGPSSSYRCVFRTGVKAAPAGVRFGDRAFFGSTGSPAVITEILLNNMTLIGDTALNVGMSYIESAVTDGTYAYVGMLTTPGMIAKIQLSNMQQVDSLSLNDGEVSLSSAFIDGDYGYFGTDTSPARIIKIQLSTMKRINSLVLAQSNIQFAFKTGLWGFFGASGYTSDVGAVVRISLSSLTYSGSMTLNSTSKMLKSGFSDGTTYGYVASNDFVSWSDTGPGTITKFLLNDLKIVSTLKLNSGEDAPTSVVFDNVFAYWGTDTSPGIIVKVRLSNLTRIGATTLQSSESNLYAAISDSSFGYWASSDGSQAKLIKVDLNSLTRIGAVNMNSSKKVYAAVTDGTHGYFGDYSNPANLLKFRLNDLNWISTCTLQYGENNIGTAFSQDEFAFFGTMTEPGIIIKMRMTDRKRIGNLVLKNGEDKLRTSFIAGEYGYAGTNTYPGIVVKFHVSTMKRVGAVELQSGENNLISSITDGEFGYFATNTYPGKIVKIRLSNLERVGSLTLNSGEDSPYAAISDGLFGYFGCATFPGTVVAVRLSNLQRVNSVLFESNENYIETAMIDENHMFGYFGTYESLSAKQGIVVQVRLADLTRVNALKFKLGEDYVAAVVGGTSNQAYFATGNAPGVAIRVHLYPLTRGEGIPLGDIAIGSSQQSYPQNLPDKQNTISLLRVIDLNGNKNDSFFYTTPSTPSETTYPCALNFQKECYRVNLSPVYSEQTSSRIYSLLTQFGALGGFVSAIMKIISLIVASKRLAGKNELDEVSMNKL